MNREELQAEIGKLRQDVASLEDVDDAGKNRIATLIEQMSHQLENPHDDTHKARLTDKMTEALESFEVAHPRITETLNRISVALGI